MTDVDPGSPAAPQQIQPNPELGAALRGLHALANILAGRGFSTRVEERMWSLVVRNEAASAPDPLSPLAIAYGPVRLVQRIRITVDPSGALAFYWEWSGPTRDSPPEVEYLGPAVALDDAAEKIARVLALADL